MWHRKVFDNIQYSLIINLQNRNIEQSLNAFYDWQWDKDVSPLLFNIVLTGGPYQFNKERKRSERYITWKERRNTTGLIYRRHDHYKDKAKVSTKKLLELISKGQVW